MYLTRRGRRRLLVLFAVAAVLGAGAVAFVGLRGAYRSHLTQKARQTGMAAYEQGDYETALQELNYVIRREHQDLEVLLAIADSRSKTPEANRRNLAAAVNSYNAALRLDPQNLDALTGLLDLYKTLRYKAELIDIADRILAVLPDHASALEAKAAILYQDGQFDEAITVIDRLASLSPRNLSWRVLHISALRNLNNDPEPLLELCDKWVDEHEGDGRFRLLKAEVLLVDAGDVEAAKEELIAAAGLGADSMEILENMLGSLEKHGLREEADQLLEQTMARFPHASWAFEVAIQQHWRSLRPNAAIAEIERAEKQLGRLDHRLLRWKALLHAVRGEQSEAGDSLDALLKMAGDLQPEERDASRGWAEAIRARIHADDGNWMDAIEAYSHALTLDPRSAILLFLLAETYQDCGEHELAIDILQRAKDLDRNWLAIDIAQAQSLLAAGRPNDAFDAMSRVIQRMPHIDVGAYLLLARAWLELGEEGDRRQLTDTRSGGRMDVLDLLLALREQMPDASELESLLAEAYLRDGNTADAVALIENSLEDNDEVDVQRLLLLAQVSQRWELGCEERLLTRAEELAGLTPAVVSAQARHLIRRGLFEQALNLIDTAAENAQDRNGFASETTELRLTVMLAAGDTEAPANMMQWLEDEPDSPRASAFVLAQDEAWEDAALIRKAVDALGDQLGESSPRVALAEATYLQRFHSGDSASISSAIAKVANVLQRTPDSKYALTLMASILLTGEDPRPDRAIQHLQHAIDLYPSDPQLYLRMIPLLQQQGDFAAAGRYLAQMASRCEYDPDLRRAELRLLEAQGDFEQATARLSAAVDSTSSENDQLYLASLYRKAGQHGQAEIIYQRLLGTPQCSSTALQQAAGFYADTGRFEEGLELLLRIEPEEGEAAGQVVVGRYCLSYGYLDMADEYLQTARHLDAEISEVWIELANLHIARNELPEARDALLRGLELDPDNPTLKTTLAVVSMSLSEIDRRHTVAMLEELHSSNPALLATMTLYDRIAHREGAATPGEDDLADARQLVQDYPQFLPAWRVAITAHADADQMDEAIRLAHQAAARLPNDPTPAEMATRLLIKVGREEEALEMARLWRRRSLDRPLLADEVIAALEMDLGRPHRTVAQLAPHADRIIKERNRHPDRFKLWLNALAASDQFDRAAALATHLLTQEPQWRGEWLNLALASDPDTGRQALEIAEPHFLESPDTCLELAIAWNRHAQQLDGVAAAAAYDRAAWILDRIPDNEEYRLTVILLRASAAAGLGNPDVAEDHYQSVLKHEPDNVIALNNLASVLVRQSTRCDDAVALASQALTLVPGDVSITDTLAQALLCAGRYTEAEQRIREALARSPGNLVCRVTLAGVLHAQGRDVEAERELKDVRQILTSMRQPDPSLMRRTEDLSRIIGDAGRASSSRSARDGGRSLAATE